MIVRNMRWGYDGGGMACGPVEGNTNVELMVMDEEGKHYFVMISRMSEFEKTMISPMSMFDIAMHMCRYKVDFDNEWGKIEEAAIEDYDYEITDIPEDIKESKFYDAIKLGRLAMQECYYMNNPDYESAQKFIEKYVDKDISKMDIPEIVEEDDFE